MLPSPMKVSVNDKSAPWFSAVTQICEGASCATANMWDLSAMPVARRPLAA